ncbi:right-handed parallel beta-helix repeat-containing protein, partial [Candidatus Woesearchaeota archaeon]|nr:right-handed parallel beta-helix repeat-containing protein [Candidatus Woesearchaeota archaeon]
MFQQVRNSEGSLSSDAVGINQSTNVLFTDNNIIESGEGYTIGEDYYISLSPMTFSGVAYANTTLILYDADNSDPITSNNFLLDNAFFNATKNYDVFTTATCTEIGAPNNYCTIYAETSLFANCANVLAFMPLTSCFSFNNNILTSNGAGNNYTAATSQFNSTFNVTTSYTYPPSISYNPSTGETYGILVDRSCNADLSNNTLINATLRFSGNSSCLAQLRYTNTNGTIAWTEQNFLSNLSLNGNLNVSAGLGISMGNNTISVNTSAFNSTTSRISSSANITLTGIKLSNVNRIMKLGAFTTNTSLIQTTGSDCIAAGTCWNLSYSGGNLLFNTTSFSSFSANESVAADTTRPLVNTTLPTVNSVYNITNIFEIAVNSTDETAISRVFVNVTYPNGTIYNFELYNKTNFPNKYNGSITLDLLRGLYNITYIANDTSNNINSSTTSNFTVNVECASIFMGAYITLHKNINSASDCFILNTNGITIDCVGYNILYATGGSGGEGVTSTGYNNITVKNCFIKGGDVGGFGDAGIRFQDGTIANFTNNTILSNGSSSANAVFIYNGTQVVINNNTLITAGSGNDNSGIELGLNSTGVNVTNNIISTNGTFNNHGIEIEEDSHHNRFTNNQITTNGTGTGGFNNGIYMYTNASSNYFENIHILTSGQKNSSALHITGISKKNTFVNVNFTVSNIDTEELVDGTGSNAVNYLVYNNSFGEIKWTDETTAFGFLQGMSTNISNSDGLGLGRNIFIGNNTI